MLTTRNIITFFGLCGLAMALSGHAWPGAFVMVGAVFGFVFSETLKHRAEQRVLKIIDLEKEEDDGDSRVLID